VLYKGGTNGTVIDSIGQVGFDPGSEWGSGLVSTADNTLRRKATIKSGDLIVNDAFDPATEWDGYAVDTFDGLGGHTSDCSGPPLPTPPILNPVGHKSVTVSNTLAFQVVATPTDGDAVTLTASNLPGGATFNATNENGSFEWIEAAPTGVYSVTFYATDDDGTDAETISITVGEPGFELLAPVIQAASDVLANQFNANWLASAGATGYRLDVATNSDFAVGGGSGETLLSEDFNAWSGTWINGWTHNSGVQYTNGGVADSRCVGMNAALDWIQSPAVTNPGTLSFYIRTSSDPGGWTVLVQTSPNGSDWTDQATIVEDGAGGTINDTPYQTNIVLNLTGTYNVRWYMSARSADSCFIDNVLITASAGGGSSFVPGYQNRDVGNVTTYAVTGLTESVTYYYRVMAYTASSNSPYSATTNVTTVAGVDVPPVLNAIGNQSVALDDNLQFQVTATPTDGDAVTLTASNLPGGATFGATNENGSFEWIGATPTGVYSVTFYATDENGTDEETISVTVFDPGSELLAPVIQAASLVQAEQFNANWLAVAGATGYILDVGTNETFTGGGGGSGGQSVLASNAATSPALITGDWSGTALGGTTYVQMTNVGAQIVSPAFSTVGFTNLTVDFRARTFGGTAKSNITVAISADNGTNWTVIGVRYPSSGSTFMTIPTVTDTANLGGAQTRIRWTAPDASAGVGVGVSNLIVRGWSSGGGASPYFVPGYENRDVGNVTTFAVTGLTEGVTYHYRAKAYNAATNSPYSAVTSVVTEASSGTPPVLNAIGGQSVFLGETLQFQVSATPTESDAVTLTASNVPAGAVFYPTNELGTFVWAAASPTGEYSVVFYATDKDGSDGEAVGIYVYPLPRVGGFVMSNGTPASATFQSVDGQEYRMEYTLDLTADPVVWEEADSDTGTGGLITLEDTNNAADIKRYYRIVAP
jgi:hypothetical protein